MADAKILGKVYLDSTVRVVAFAGSPVEIVWIDPEGTLLLAETRTLPPRPVVEARTATPEPEAADLIDDNQTAQRLGRTTGRDFEPTGGL